MDFLGDRCMNISGDRSMNILGDLWVFLEIYL